MDRPNSRATRESPETTETTGTMETTAWTMHRS